MSDEELDDVVRRSAEAYPDELPLAGWLRLEDRLNEASLQQRLQRQVNRRVGQLFVLEVLLVALTLLWWHGRPQPGRHPAAEVPAALGAATPTKPAPSAVARRAASKPRTTAGRAGAMARLAPLVSSPVVTDVAPAVKRPAARVGTPAPRGLRPTAASYRRLPLAAAAATRRPFPASASPAAEAAALQPQAPGLDANRMAVGSETLAATPRPVAADDGATAASAPAAAVLPSVPAASLAAVVSSAPPVLLSSDNTPATSATAVPPAADGQAQAAPPAAPPDSARAPRPKPARPPYRLLLGGQAAPELAAVRTSDLTRPGSTLGLTAEYRFSSRLRVRSGLLRSTKRYAARGTDYRPPASYWTWRVPVDRIDADCRILEIPLDVRYELRQRPAYALFASAGLTTLLMRNEQYTYHYDLNGQYVQRTWTLARGGNQPLSMLSLSVGYERALGARWSAQAEPFVKLPLAGVGFGKIPLRSAGISFGLKYGLLASRAAL